MRDGLKCGGHILITRTTTARHDRARTTTVHHHTTPLDTTIRRYSTPTRPGSSLQVSVSDGGWRLDTQQQTLFYMHGT